MRRPDLKLQLDALPAKPGVYRFLAPDEEVLYVGKARDLRARVRSYFHDSADHSPKIERLIERTASIDWIVTSTELEALLLEMNLIKVHQPHFNVLLKDDKRYPYIKVAWSQPFPKVIATRRVEDDGGRYYGPYTSAAAMRETLHSLRRVFPYRDCDRTITGHDRRACLYFDIGLCSGPCVGAVDEARYRAMIGELCRFLEGDVEEVVAGMRHRMAEHAERLEFELAAKLRDRLAAIEKVVARQRIISPSLVDRDVIGLAREGGIAIAQVFFVRDGRLLGRDHFRLGGVEEVSDAEILSSFITQFYDDPTPVPGEVVLPELPSGAEVIRRWLASRRGTRVRLTVPVRGPKREMVELAMENAGETLRALKQAYGMGRGDEQMALKGLQDVLGLPRCPKRIECYDISNLQGTDAVGAMVVFEDGVPCKADYRHFRIRAAAPGDDYAAMAEVLERRFRRLLSYRAAIQTESRGAMPPGSFDKTPDLVVVDGGKGQLGAAQRVLQELALDEIPVVALAKRYEELYRPGDEAPVVLPRDSQALQLVQRVRDEAHRFAIAYHHKLRGQGSLRSTLDAVPGIGPRRKRALLAHFGSLARIRQASVEELASVPGMNRRIAEQLKAAL